MPSFDIEVPALSRGLLDRSEDVRDPASVAAAWPAAKVLKVHPTGRFPLVVDAAGTRLALEEAAGWGAVPPPGAVLLGSVEDTHHWAVPAEPVGSPAPSVPPAAPSPTSLTAATGTIRSAGPLLSDDEAALATTAVALLGWHAGAGFCSRCGAPTSPDATGHSRSCPSGHQEFPRTDPAVIVLVHDGEGNAVLARQPSWAPGRFSVLAGFAEAGESLEATVVREIGEEIGVRVRDVQYLGSQPWPFPRSLMIAFSARAPRGAMLRPRPGEIEQARWFSRDRLRALLEAGPGTGRAGSGLVGGGSGDGSGGGSGDGSGRGSGDGSGRGSGDGSGGDEAPAITLPDSVSIARRMVEGFVRAG